MKDWEIQKEMPQVFSTPLIKDNNLNQFEKKRQTITNRIDVAASLKFIGSSKSSDGDMIVPIFDPDFLYYYFKSSRRLKMLFNAKADLSTGNGYEIRKVLDSSIRSKDGKERIKFLIETSNNSAGIDFLENIRRFILDYSIFGYGILGLAHYRARAALSNRHQDRLGGNISRIFHMVSSRCRIIKNAKTPIDGMPLCFSSFNKKVFYRAFNKETGVENDKIVKTLQGQEYIKLIDYDPLDITYGIPRFFFNHAEIEKDCDIRKFQEYLIKNKFFPSLFITIKDGQIGEDEANKFREKLTAMSSKTAKNSSAIFLAVESAMTVFDNNVDVDITIIDPAKQFKDVMALADNNDNILLNACGFGSGFYLSEDYDTKLRMVNDLVIKPMQRAIERLLFYVTKIGLGVEDYYIHLNAPNLSSFRDIASSMRTLSNVKSLAIDEQRKIFRDIDSNYLPLLEKTKGNLDEEEKIFISIGKQVYSYKQLKEIGKNLLNDDKGNLLNGLKRIMKKQEDPTIMYDKLVSAVAAIIKKQKEVLLFDKQ